MKRQAGDSKEHPYASLKKELEVDGKTYSYFDFAALDPAKANTLPFSIRILLESASATPTSCRRGTRRRS